MYPNWRLSQFTFCVKIQNDGRRHLQLLFCNSGPPTKCICAPESTPKFAIFADPRPLARRQPNFACGVASRISFWCRNFGLPVTHRLYNSLLLPHKPWLEYILLYCVLRCFSHLTVSLRFYVNYHALLLLLLVVVVLVLWGWLLSVVVNTMILINEANECQVQSVLG